MKRWLQFFLLLLAPLAFASVPETKRIPRFVDFNGNLVPAKNTLHAFAYEQETQLTVLTKHGAFGMLGISEAAAAMGYSLNAEV